MEYLDNINDSLKTINEDNIKYLNLFEYPELFYGTTNFTGKHLDLCKFPKEARDEMKKYGQDAVNEMNGLNSAGCGVRLRFKTNSHNLIFKVKFKRKFGYLKMVNWGSFGFDVYEIKDDNYIHRTVFAPMDGHDMFAEKVGVPSSGQLCIFLPNYNTIEELYIGIDSNSTVKTIPYPDNKKLPILFYGNSVTQGAAASHSGNSFPNIVSKILNRDIINISCSSCCRGTKTMANLLGQINCHTIIIDYTRNAYNIDALKKTHEPFYKKVRSMHPNTKIILMTSECFNHWFDFDVFDDIVFETYHNAIANGDNVEIVYQRELFDDDDYDIMMIDSTHYIDYAMNIVAQKICELIKQE